MTYDSSTNYYTYYQTGAGTAWDSSLVTPSDGWILRVSPNDYKAGDWGPATTTITTDTTWAYPPLDLSVEGDIRAPKFEERFKEEIMQMVQQYINQMMPLLIDIVRNAPSMFGVEKKLTDGVFCFNCGAPIKRGMEKEPCPYCGR